jgi:subtilase family serine protease
MYVACRFALLLLVSLSFGFEYSSNAFNSKYWVRGDRAPASSVHSVVFGVQLKDNAAASCDSLLLKVSTPGSSLYRKYLSFNEAGQMFRNVNAENRLLSFLRRNGVLASEMRKSPHGEFVRVTTSVSKLEKLLGAKYVTYTAKEDSRHVIVRDLEYSVPAQLKSFVDFVSDTYVLPVPPSIASKAFHFAPASRTKQSSNVSPSLLNSFYKITSNVVHDAGATQVFYALLCVCLFCLLNELACHQSLFESLGQSYVPSDLTQFQQQYNLPVVPIAKVVGANQPSQCAQNVNNCFEVRKNTR